MEVLKKLLSGLFILVFALQVAFATQEQVLIQMNEYVDQTVIFNPLKTASGIWTDVSENQSSYEIRGELIVSNSNADGRTISDIYISFTNTGNITLPVNVNGRNGTFILDNVTSGDLILHIPELAFGENSTWNYSVNTTNIRPPLNMISSYSDSKVLAGDNISITDTLVNEFDNFPFQTDTCIFNINLTQVTVPVDFLGTPYDFLFIQSTLGGPDAGNVGFTPDNLTMNWNVLGGGCLNQFNQTNITYDVLTPLNIPATTDYVFVNTTLEYRLNNTISHLRVVDIKAISEAEVSFEKQIISPSHPTLFGSNVTWNVTGYFFTGGTNITYDLYNVTLWVSQRNVNGSYTDPNTIDNDTISGTPLYNPLSPGAQINITSPWTSPSWFFNYSDIPSPIVWMDVNFSIRNDGVQLVNRSVTQNGNDIFIKELYLIIGYWLEIEKNVTSLSNDTYNIRIDVHNKGNQVTPANTAVTIYDFIPSGFNLTGPFVYSISPWYSTAQANNTIIGDFNGSLQQWGLIPTNPLNTSFAQGPIRNENTTWSVEYNVTGLGDYRVMDVFITGLDPQLVDGAGASKSVVVSEVIERIKSTEGIFAVVAGILLLLGLLL